jgi:hypothetical protein
MDYLLLKGYPDWVVKEKLTGRIILLVKRKITFYGKVTFNIYDQEERLLVTSTYILFFFTKFISIKYQDSPNTISLIRKGLITYLKCADNLFRIQYKSPYAKTIAYLYKNSNICGKVINARFLSSGTKTFEINLNCNDGLDEYYIIYFLIHKGELDYGPYIN